MEIFGTMGFTFGVMGFIFGTVSCAVAFTNSEKIKKIEEKMDDFEKQSG